MDGENQDINVPLADWVRQIVKTTVNECVPKIIEEHRIDCPINDLKNDYYGNGKPGTKTDVLNLINDVQKLKNCKRAAKGFMAKIAAPVITGLILAFIFFMLNLYSQQKIDKAIAEIQKTVSEK